MSEALEQAEALLKAAEEATPGPWIVHDYKRSNVSAYKIERGLSKTSVALRIANKDGLPVVTKRGLASPSTDQGKHTAAFIALARNTAPAIALALLEKHRALEEAEESRAVDLELLAQFMIQHSFATGHGDSIGALLAELDWQLRERTARKNCTTR